MKYINLVKRKGFLVGAGVTLSTWALPVGLSLLPKHCIINVLCFYAIVWWSQDKLPKDASEIDGEESA